MRRISAGLLRCQQLVVSPLEQEREQLLELLSYHYRVVTLDSTAEVVARVASTPPDLVMMGDDPHSFDGVALCQELRQLPTGARLPLLLLCNSGDLEREREAVFAGVTDLFHRPLSPHLLELRLRHHLQLYHQSELLHRISFRDEATGLFNRRAFDLFLDREVQAAVRRNEELTLQLVEIDGFDDHRKVLSGEQVEQLLQATAALLERIVQRTSDVVARFSSSGRFALILPDTDLKGAEQVGELLQRLYQELDSTVEGTKSLTIGSITARATATLTAIRLLQFAEDSTRIARDRSPGGIYCSDDLTPTTVLH